MPPDWYFDEQAHAGEEHLDPARVADYDEKIPFDPSDEIDHLLDHGLSQADTVVDFGTGTGEFPVAVAEHCDRVVGVDVSEPMFQVAREKARGLDNVTFVNTGVLRYEHAGPRAGYAFSKNALHHLPDFWKTEALRTIGESLEPDGILRLHDLIYSFDPTESHQAIEDWLAAMESTRFTEVELDRHFSREFSTFDFVMEALLEHTGFEIIETAYRREFYAAYTCRWAGPPRGP